MKVGWLLLPVCVASCSPREFSLGTPFVVERLTAEWTTSNAIRWRWTSTGEPVAFAGFELTLAPTREDLETDSARCYAITEAQSPELGDWILPETSGPSRTTGTTTIHDPGTTWFARLTYTDGSRTATTEPASGTTLPPATGELVVFHDDPPAGFTIPDTFTFGTSSPFEGTADYEYAVDCGGAATCWENLRFYDLSLDLASVPADAWDATAFVEVAVATHAPHSYWGELVLTFEACPDCRYGYRGWTLKGDGEYHVYQFPIAALTAQGARIPRAHWDSGLMELRVGAAWPTDTVVTVDDVSLRW